MLYLDPVSSLRDPSSCTVPTKAETELDRGKEGSQVHGMGDPRDLHDVDVDHVGVR